MAKYAIHKSYRSAICAGWVVLFHRGDRTAGGDSGQRLGAGFVTRGISGLSATLALSGGRRKQRVFELGMKRNQLIKNLSAHGAFLLREGSGHSIYQLGYNKTQVPRHTEVLDELTRQNL
jgi:hypothetical protein